MARRPTQAEWSKISALFGTLVELPADARATRLSRIRADPFIIDQLRSLLAEETDTGVLDATLGDGGGDAATPITYASLAPGTRIGAYRIDRLIGRGGMGEVYLARRDKVDFVQHVALKLLRPEAAGRARLFDAERQLLAGLEHPGIARLIDGGIADDGRAFMALEYVDGHEIGAWCAAHHADLTTRLRLFLEICDAVEYAHARLVLHLDIKPSNILIDGDGRTRLLDFGIARLIDAAATDRTQTRALLTPDYAAPEQFSGARPTVTSDVYALGAVLFELLAGRGPWKFDDAPMPTVLRRLLHEDPSFPSMVTEPGSIAAPRIKGDLDAIVMKAMRRDPASRYPGVAALAADIRRYLNFEPVQARAGSAAYRAGRFLRRNRWTVLAATVALLMLLTGAAGIAWQARQTAVERDTARTEARKAQAVNAAITLMFGNARNNNRGGAVSARDLLNESAEELVRSFDAASPETAAVVAAIADLYVQIDDPASADAILTKALAKGVGNDAPEDRATLQTTLGTAKAAMGKFDEATPLLDQAEAIWRADPDRFRQQRLETISARAMILRLQGKREEGIALLTASLPDAERVYADKPREILTRYNNIVVHLIELNRVDEADAILKRAEAKMQGTGAERSPVAVSLIQLRGGILSRRGDLRGALQQFQRAAALRRELFGPSIGLAGDLLSVGRVMVSLGQTREALPVLTEGAQLARVYLGPASQHAVMFGVTLAEAQANLGNVAAARTSLDGVTLAAEAFGRTHLIYGVYLRGRAQLRVAEKRFDEAQADYDAAEAVYKKVGPAAVVFADSLPKLREQLSAARMEAKPR